MTGTNWKAYTMFEPQRWAVLEDAVRHITVPGDIVVIGVAQGGLVGWLAEKYPDRRVWGFCRFDSGLSQPSKADSPGLYEGACETRFEETAARLTPFTNVVLVPGDVRDTFHRDKPAVVAFAIVDLDLYEPTKHCLEVLQHTLAEGGHVLVDDWDWSGVTRAIDETPFPHSEVRGYLKELWK